MLNLTECWLAHQFCLLPMYLFLSVLVDLKSDFFLEGGDIVNKIYSEFSWPIKIPYMIQNDWYFWDHCTKVVEVTYRDEKNNCCHIQIWRPFYWCENFLFSYSWQEITWKISAMWTLHAKIFVLPCVQTRWIYHILILCKILLLSFKINCYIIIIRYRLRLIVNLSSSCWEVYKNVFLVT